MSVRLLHQPFAFFLSDDLAVEEMDFAFSVRREARIVRHHADGRAVAMQILQ
jgi:hypothetical protein